MTEDETVLILSKDSPASQFQMMAVEEDAEVLDHSVLLKDGSQVSQVDARYTSLG